MRRIFPILIHWVLPCLILGTAIGTVYVLGKKPKNQRKKPPPRIAVPVEVVNAEKHHGDLEIRMTGVAVPYREVELSAEVAGRIIQKAEALRPGRYVEAGEELLRIDPSNYDLEVARLTAELAKVDADIKKTEIDRENTRRLIALSAESVQVHRREFERIESLGQSGVTSQSEYDLAKQALLTAQQELTKQENLIRQLDATTTTLELTKKLASIQLENASLDLARTVLKAPCSGVVVKTHVEQNAYLQPGELVALIDDTSRVEVRCNLLPTDLDYVVQRRLENDEVGAAFTSTAAAYELPSISATITYRRATNIYRWHGTLSRQDGLGMDERTRTIPVRIVVDRPLVCEVQSADQNAKPIPLMRGMFVQVGLLCTPARPLLKIPEETIRPGKTVWIMENDQLKITPIQIARIEKGTAFVDARDGLLSSLHAIISSPVPGAKDGLAVTLNAPRKRGPGEGKKKRGPGKGRAKGVTAGPPEPTGETNRSLNLVSDERTPG